jgi:negative regulator of sigma E activity
MNPLESRKQLLIAESELNRAQLVQEFQTMTDEVNSLAHQARTITSFASAAATLVAGVVSFRQKKTAPAPEKPSWLRIIVQGAGLAGSLWSDFRARSKK